jgi:hypothetical protein
MRSIIVVGLVIAVAVSADATAQGLLREVVVTGSRVMSDDYSSIPAISIEKRADFLVQRVRLTNDTRALDGRRAELYQTVRDLVNDASKRPSLALGFGDDFLVPITPKDYEIPLAPGTKRPDTTSTEFYLKRQLGPTDDVALALRELTTFIAKARMSGRTEIEPLYEVALSVVDPEKYRYEIIAQIAADAKRLQGAVGVSCKIDISGLSGRVSWQRSDVSQLMLYIPYEVNLRDCQ